MIRRYSNPNVLGVIQRGRPECSVGRDTDASASIALFGAPIARVFGEGGDLVTFPNYCQFRYDGLFAALRLAHCLA